MNALPGSPEPKPTPTRRKRAHPARNARRLSATCSAFTFVGLGAGMVVGSAHNGATSTSDSGTQVSSDATTQTTVGSSSSSDWSATPDQSSSYPGSSNAGSTTYTPPVNTTSRGT
jgi:hypothetical protein